MFQPHRNIIQVLDRANETTVLEGKEWYPNAQRIAMAVGRLARPEHTRGTQVMIGAGILSALSPQTNWDLNIVKAFQFIEYFQRPTFTTTSNYTKAMNVITYLDEAMASPNPVQYIEDLMGVKAPKQRAFFRNIQNPESDYGPTIDRHAIGIYLNRKPTKDDLRIHGGGNALKEVVNAYRKASAETDLHYNELQAITWLQWRSE